MDDTSLFFKPRLVHVQGRLEFISVPPERCVVLPVESDEFVGLSLHWNGSQSVACKDPENCALHAMGNVPRDYFWAPAYVYSYGTKDWRRFVLPIGENVAPFADRHLRGRVWKIRPRTNTRSRKCGLIVEPQSVSADVERDVAALEPFDIKSRLLVRYNVQ